MIVSSIASSKVYAEGKTRDNSFPVLSLVTTPVFIAEDAAFSLCLEAGAKSNRVNGTLGYFADENNRFKISAEYLSQKLRFKFDDRDRDYHEGLRRWLHQFAIGGKYQYIFECPSCFSGLELGLFYSNSPGKKLSEHSEIDDSTLFRRIAGADNWQANAGFLFNPWRCARLTPYISYQQTTYRREYQDKKRISGVGFGLTYNQKLFYGLDFDLKYQYTQAFDDLRAGLYWNKIFECGALGLGVFVDHVFGKRELLSSTTTGLELSFAFGVCGCDKVSLLLSDDSCCCGISPTDLLDWVAEPAVYMPEVLAIRDRLWCTPPGAGPSSGFDYSGPGFHEIHLNEYFESDHNQSEIYYDVEITGDDHNYVSYSSYNDTIYVQIPESASYEEVEVTVYAENKCGSSSDTFPIYIDIP